MIKKGSRYRRADAFATADPRRSSSPLLGLAPARSKEGDVRRLHRVAEGERLDQIAQRYYGDPGLYWRICEANDELFPEDLMVPGRVLRIPRIS